MSGKSYVTIEGFTVARANDKNIRVQTSNNITIKNNTVIQAYGYGIQFDNADASSISGNKVYGNRNHGIGLTAGSTGNVVELNESYDNTDGLPRDPGTLFANGLYLTGSQNNGSSGNEIRGNNFHHNKDTGGHIQGYSSNNIFLQNRSWSNGQHGFDHTSDSTGTIHVGDIAYGNAQDGFQIETRATGTKIYNSISVNNGTGHYNLEVRPDSISGFASDYNIWWRTDNLARIKWNGTTYNTVCNTEPPNDTFCEVSSGNDTHGTQADPKFFGPAWGDFFLLDATSPAVDSADSSVAQWPQTDAYGQAREDDPKPDTGFGPFPYAERGAVEFLANPTNLTTNGSFETDTSGWGPYGGSTIQRVSGGQSGSWGLEMQGTATLTTFGTNDSPNWVSSTPAAGRRYRFAAWVRSATNVGNAKLRVREYLNGQQQGTTTYSNEVVLSPTWQGLSVEYVAVAAGSTLDFQVLDYPQALSEVFQVDNIQIWLLP
jgi:hypothetical protein